MVGLDDGGVAQALHEGAQRTLAPSAGCMPDFQFDDCETVCIGCAEQVHLAEALVRLGCIQWKLVVE